MGGAKLGQLFVYLVFLGLHIADFVGFVREGSHNNPMHKGTFHPTFGMVKLAVAFKGKMACDGFKDVVAAETFPLWPSTLLLEFLPANLAQF